MKGLISRLRVAWWALRGRAIISKVYVDVTEGIQDVRARYGNGLLVDGCYFDSKIKWRPMYYLPRPYKSR